MKLTNLKLTKKERKATGDVPTKAAESKDSYPWGLEIRLETESIKKLGLDIRSFQIGQKIKVEAVTEVTEVSNTKTDDGDRQTIRLQVQDLGLNRGKSRVDRFNEKQEEGPE